MAKQINQYTKTRTQGTVQDDDLLDFDSTEDSGASYESAKITIVEFLAYINSNVDNIYTANGSLPENRVVTSATYYTQFLGGDVTVRMADETFDYGFLVEDLGGTERARLGYDQATASGEILLSNFADGDWFSAKDKFVGIGNTTKSFTEIVRIAGNTKIDNQLAIGQINSGNAAIVVFSGWVSEEVVNKGGNYLGISGANVVSLNTIGATVQLRKSGNTMAQFTQSNGMSNTFISDDAVSGTPNKPVTFNYTASYWDGAAAQQKNAAIEHITTDTSGASRFNFDFASVTKHTFLDDGKVGILTTTPNSTLDVIGDISSTEGYDLGNALFLHATQNGDRDAVGSGNIYVGDLCGQATTTATNNVGIGRGALQSIQSGFANVAIGSFALDINTVGRDNVAIGGGAFTNLSDAALGNCSYNTAVGQNAFANTTIAAGVVGVGLATGSNITIGTDLTLLGRNTGATTAGTYSDSVAIGAYAAFNGNNQCVMGSQNSGASLDNFYFGAGIEATAINPTKITFNITNISAGQTDTASDYDWEFNGSRGTGTGLGGDIYFQTAPAGTTGTAQNALVEALRIKQSGVINMGNLPTSSAGLVAGDLWNNAGVINIV